MGAARIAAIVLGLISCAALSQQAAMSRLTVAVKDQTNALIPGAQVTVSNAESGLQFRAEAEKSGPNAGEAILNLEPGRYVLRVHAAGFKTGEEEDTEVRADMIRIVILSIGDVQLPCTLPCEVDLPIPEEHAALSTEVLSLPLQQFVPPAKRLHSRLRWF